MPIKLKDGFRDYINGLSTLKNSSKKDYLAHVNRIEKYGTEDLDQIILKSEAHLSAYVNKLGVEYDGDKTKTRQRPFEDMHNTKVVLRHYLRFLISIEIEQQQVHLEKAGEFNITNEKEGKAKAWRSIAIRRGQPKFRNALLIAYSGKCSFTGTGIQEILEAAHIIPYNGDSTNTVSNGLLLRSDIHALFDLGLISIDPSNLKIFCSKQIREEEIYKTLHCKIISLPQKENEHPNKKALELHFIQRII